MTILQSWKSSLPLAGWAQFSALISQVAHSLSAVYTRWFMYGCWGLIAYTVINWVEPLPAVNHWLITLPYWTQSYLFVLALCFSFSYCMIHIIAKQVLNNERTALSNYSKHMLYGIAIVTVVTLLFLFIFFISLFAMPRAYLHKGAPTIEEFEHIVGHTRSVLAIASVSAFKCSVRALLFFMFFFLDAQATVRGIGMSIINAIKFVIYNLPVLVIFHLYGLVASIILNAILAFVLGGMVAHPVTLLIVHLIALPILVTLYRAIYTKCIREQRNLYVA